MVKISPLLFIPGTWGYDFIHGYSGIVCHESNDGKYHKPGKETCTTVHKGNKEGMPAMENQGISSLSGKNHRPLARYVNLRVAHAPGMPGTFSRPLVSDPDTHHGKCVTRVPWCMPWLLTSGFLWSRCREDVPGIPAHAQPAILRIWQEAHVLYYNRNICALVPLTGISTAGLQKCLWNFK